MSQRSENKLAPMDDVSALVDGELDESAVARVCAQWRSDEATREAWHTYQLIGDVLRSEDLAAAGARDAAFLTALRGRLAAEPVVLAPQSAEPASAPVIEPAVANGATGRRAWRRPAAMVAGIAVVASVLVVTRMPGSPAVDVPEGTVLASGPAGQAAAPTLVAAGTATAGATEAMVRDEAQVVLDGDLIRDARLDEYLAAHKKFGGSSGPGAPSGFLRNAAATGR
ncbi:sigma-E factor negative regulatory protein [Rhizobacter sp. LjRoot28]|uniref:sigma-E factor negative regulatory protein n=1 Tax=Rhizobacter sp. LjRoot28 TaxID=3342309 RepID=UPI003ECDB50D